MLTIPEPSAQPGVTADLYRQLLEKLPSHTRIEILTHRSSRKEVENWSEVAERTTRVGVVEVRDSINFTDWAQDPYVMVQSEGHSIFVEPYSFRRLADSLTAEIAARDLHLSTMHAPLYFEGGNLLVGDDFFFIGADYPTRSLEHIPDVIRRRPGTLDADLIRQLYQEYFDTTRRMIILESTAAVPVSRFELGEDAQGFWVAEYFAGNSFGTVQPLFHIDMFISLAGRSKDGRYRVLVGDPGSAARLLGVEPWPHAMQDAFDSIAKKVEEMDEFLVLRNPLPLCYWVESVSRNFFLERDEHIAAVLKEQGVEEVPLFHWYFATSNNALVEITTDSRTVWIPTYGHGSWSELSSTDGANISIWRDRLGFDVQVLGDYHLLAQHLGAVHCISKYLSRS